MYNGLVDIGYSSVEERAGLVRIQVMTGSRCGDELLTIVLDQNKNILIVRSSIDIEPLVFLHTNLKLVKNQEPHPL